MTAAPLLRVVRGEPSAQELAALVTVLAARASAVPAPAPGTAAVGPSGPVRCAAPRTGRVAGVGSAEVLTG